MGVCKCKQRNVTNQFCYVCRMNVCESCMVKDHQKCIIKSYVHWLQDSDYSPTCSLCRENINKGEVVRLSCYDLFHWDCINAWALKFPENASPTTYQCPDCRISLFPPAALVSPVADVLRQKLSTVAWGRRGLGLPKSGKEQKRETVPVNIDASSKSSAVSTELWNATTKVKPVYSSQVETSTFNPLPKQTTPTDHQKIPYSREKYSTEVLRKVVDTRTDDSKINVSFDHDENKYKRKGVVHWVGNLLKLNKSSTSQRKEVGLTFKKVFLGLVISVVGFMLLIYLMMTFGRGSSTSDALLDPENNPHIRVAQKNLGMQISK